MISGRFIATITFITIVHRQRRYKLKDKGPRKMGENARKWMITQNLKSEMERYMKVHIDEDRAQAFDLKQ